ncbi:hypothetical protein E4U17_007013 [Claviceps sp. LM77 group G4]|nr:hypothetical protein E4U17_007013 [Claviceps sp. LM77 group G4]KAG6059774.1 hypothetical protein E4U33_007051 [Claviceps sp. LM78 group G4]
MPTYLCHGFRWYRRCIRPFVILNDLDECAPDWIVEPLTASVILSQLAESFAFVPRLEGNDDDDKTSKAKAQSIQAAPLPHTEKQPSTSYDDDLSLPLTSRVPPAQDRILMHTWSPVKLLEEYDENETTHGARPYAYIADYVVRVDLGADVGAAMAVYEETLRERNGTWFDKLRENVQPEEQARWYIVVCDDTEREVPTEGELVEDEQEGMEELQEEDEVGEQEKKHQQDMKMDDHDDDDDADGVHASAAEGGTSTNKAANGSAPAQQRVVAEGSGEPSAAVVAENNKALPSIPAQAQAQAQAHAHAQAQEQKQKQKQKQTQTQTQTQGQEKGEKASLPSSASAQPSFLTQDPFESPPQPHGRIRKKLSLRRLFTKKEG